MPDVNTWKLRVIVLGQLPPPYGGMEVMTQTLIAGLAQVDDLIFKNINTQVSLSLAEKGGRHQFRKSWLGYKQAAQLVWLLITFRPDVVYMTLTNSPSFLGFLRDALFLAPALLFRKKVVVHLHGGYYFYVHVKGLRLRLVRSLLGRVNLAIVLGNRLVNVFNGIVPTERIVVIPNGIDDRPFDEAAGRVSRDEHRSLKRILFVGLMCPEKGFRDIISAAPNVPNAEFVFAGEWSSSADEKEVREFLRQNGIENRVKFAGVVSGPCKYDLFLSSDIFVFPTYFVYEGHAVSIVEALAAGLPIICTDHGALNESVVADWNGYFVPRSNPDAIAVRLNQLILDEGKRKTMALNSRKLYEERFTLEKFIDNWSRAVKSCASRRET